MNHLARSLVAAALAASGLAAAQTTPIGDPYYVYYFYDAREAFVGTEHVVNKVLARSGEQHAGVLFENHAVGSTMWGIPGGGIATAYNDGKTFWTQTVAPHIGGTNTDVIGGYTDLFVAQSFVKDSLDATLSFTFSAGSMQLMDYGGRAWAPAPYAGAAFRVLAVEHATSELVFEEAQSVQAFADFSFGAPRWDLAVHKEWGPLASGDAPWSWSSAELGNPAYGFMTATLDAPYTQQIRIDEIALGEEFTVSFHLQTWAIDKKQGETGAVAYAQDPLSGSGGPGFAFAGLTPTNRPIATPVPEPATWALMALGVAALLATRRRATSS